MTRLGFLAVSALGLLTAHCAGAAPPATRVASGPQSTMSDATPAVGRAATTLATAISAPTAEGAASAAADEPTTNANADTKAERPAADDGRRAAEASAIPAACSEAGVIKGKKLCLPERAFTKKLCASAYPEVALALFGKGTPWTRVYLAGDVEAWNASGGRTHRANLAFDEEVLVLGKRDAASAGGIVMTGAQANYDVLRWDGTCVSVMEGEITTRRPPTPKPAEVPFRRLEEPTRHALLATPKVKATHDALSKACTTIVTSSAKKSCEKADKAFTLAISEAIRAGAALPAPGRRL